VALSAKSLFVCAFQVVGATIFHQAHAFERGQIALVELSKGMASIIPKYAINCSEALARPPII
jgi:hypothetical protein